MPEIKEKPQAGKPKGRRKSAGPPRQAGRLMKEKLIREVDQRKEREAGADRKRLLCCGPGGTGRSSGRG